MTKTSKDITLSIRQMCDRFDVTPRTLRFYEDKALLMPERRGTRRVYHHREVVRMTLIQRGKRFGFSLEEIRWLLELYKGGDGQKEQLLNARRIARARLDDMKSQRASMDAAIADLSEQIAIGEDLLANLLGSETNTHTDEDAHSGEAAA